MLRLPLIAVLFASLLAVARPQAALAFGFEDVAALAARNAGVPWVAPRETLPPELAALDYDGLRDIRYRPEQALWQGGPYELQLFHLGRGLRTPVALHEVIDGQARELPYDPAAWDFGRHRFDRSGWGGLGHAGFRVHHALNSAAYKDELLVFLGASYFRALGRGQQYGLSARALAIDTVGAPSGQGEEFARFTAFWVERPATTATPPANAPETATAARDATPAQTTAAAATPPLAIHALLDSPRATGAYRFTVRPGETTTLEVQARIFLRERVATLGLAPLTSMFLHGEMQPQPSDFRPEVHDSDGLSLAADGEWLWRPLLRPARPLASSFAVQRLQGFGLMQRDRRFASYEDTEARYERRPSAWVEPLGDWGPGRVELLLLPSPDETEDNVVAYWVPALQPAPGQPLDIGWRVSWQGDTMALPPSGHTVQSRRGRGWAAPEPGEQQWVVDFDGPALRALPAGADVSAVASAPLNARVLAAQAFPHPLGGWRLQLRVMRLDPNQAMELRAYLRHGAHALTETWTALIPRESRD